MTREAFIPREFEDIPGESMSRVAWTCPGCGHRKVFSFLTSMVFTFGQHRWFLCKNCGVCWYRISDYYAGGALYSTEGPNRVSLLMDE